MAGPGSFLPDAVDLEALDAAFTAALAGRGDLLVVGFGEISTVFAWPPEDPVVAVKSLPAFDSAGRVDAYTGLLAEYLEALLARGVEPVPTAVRSLPTGRGGGARRAYVLQPLLDPAALGSVLLAGGGEPARALLRDIVAAVESAVDERTGLDAQVSNWVRRDDGRLAFLDVSTPMLRDERGLDRLDTGLFVRAVPWVMRGAVRRWVAPELLAPYYDRRRVVLDTAGNLIRERLASWIVPLLQAANPYLDPPLTEAEVRRFYRSNARTWAALQAARRLDRAWQEKVRRRPSEFLLPHHYER